MSKQPEQPPGFPPLVDASAAPWSLSSPSTSQAIAERINSVVSGLARERLEMGNHIYGFPLPADSLKEADYEWL